MMESKDVATEKKDKVTGSSTQEPSLMPDEEIAELEKFLSEEPDDFQAGAGWENCILEKEKWMRP